METTSNQIDTTRQWDGHAGETTNLASSTRWSSALRVVLGATAVSAALVTAGLVAITALTPDRELERVDSGPTVADRGSIVAIEHREALDVSGGASVGMLADRGSMVAIEHREALAVSRGASVGMLADRGSIVAIEHREALD